MEKNSLLRRDTKNIIKNWLKNIIFTWVLIWFLFFIFNIFAGLLLKENKISENITSKIWMYFYIQDENQENWDEIYKKIINIKDQLANHWIRSEFSSKNDAFSYLETKIPEITNNFEKFGIENTLPSTLYVMFKNKKEYWIMKDIIVANRDIILNVKDVDKWATLQQQENRALKVIEIISTIKNTTLFIIIMLSVIIITFTQHLLKHFFFDFYKEIQVKKLLWATHTDANWWFLLTLVFTITLWFIVWYIFTFFTIGIINHHLVSIWINLALNSILPVLIIPYFVFTIIAIILGYIMLKKMEKKL